MSGLELMTLRPRTVEISCTTCRMECNVVTLQVDCTAHFEEFRSEIMLIHSTRRYAKTHFLRQTSIRLLSHDIFTFCHNLETVSIFVLGGRGEGDWLGRYFVAYRWYKPCVEISAADSSKWALQSWSSAKKCFKLTQLVRRSGVFMATLFPPECISNAEETLHVRCFSSSFRL